MIPVYCVKSDSPCCCRASHYHDQPRYGGSTVQVCMQGAQRIEWIVALAIRLSHSHTTGNFKSAFIDFISHFQWKCKNECTTLPVDKRWRSRRMPLLPSYYSIFIAFLFNIQVSFSFDENEQWKILQTWEWKHSLSQVAKNFEREESLRSDSFVGWMAVECLNIWIYLEKKNILLSAFTLLSQC